MKTSYKIIMIVSMSVLATLWADVLKSQENSLSYIEKNCGGELNNKANYGDCIDMLQESDFDTGYSIKQSPLLADPVYIGGVKYTLDLATDLNVTTIRAILQNPGRYGYHRLDGYCHDIYDFWDDDCRLEELKQQYHIDAVYEASVRIPVSGDEGQLLNFDVFGKIDNAVAWFSVRCGSFREIDISDNIIISQTERTSGTCDEIRVYFKPRRPFNYRDPTLKGFLSIIISESF